MKTAKLACIVLAFGVSACATSFTGEAHVEGGPHGCAEKCQKWGEEFVGMVALGEYSDACVCRVPGRTVAFEDVAGVAGGAAGVWTQNQRRSDSP